jgi:hypothetical protein
VTAADGTFSTIGLPAGTYSVGASVAGTSVRIDGVWVPSDYTARVALELGGQAASIEPQKPAAFTPIRVNAGGTAYTDPHGVNWSGDTNFAGGGHNASGAPVQNTATPELYKSERFGIFLYRFTVPNGTYLVRLKFAEIVFDAPGKRIFGVAINGQRVLSQFDVFAQAGGRNVAVDRQFAVNVTGGQIVIETLPVLENPKVSAVEIIAASGAGTSNLTARR